MKRGILGFMILNNNAMGPKKKRRPKGVCVRGRRVKVNAVIQAHGMCVCVTSTTPLSDYTCMCAENLRRNGPMFPQVGIGVR